MPKLLAVFAAHHLTNAAADYEPKARAAMARLRREQVEQIRRDHRPQEVIAAVHGVDQCTISDIRRQATWRWL